LGGTFPPISKYKKRAKNKKLTGGQLFLFYSFIEILYQNNWSPSSEPKPEI